MVVRLVVCLLDRSFVCHNGDSSDITMAFENTQVIQTWMDDEWWMNDNGWWIMDDGWWMKHFDENFDETF